MEKTPNPSLEPSELRKENLRRTLQQVHDNASSILLLTVQWKELEEHFDNVHSSIEERSKELLAIEVTIKEHLKELKERETKLNAAQDLIKEREEKLGLDEESIEERFRQVEVIEKEFELSQKLAVEEQRKGIKGIEWIEESRKELKLGQEYAQKMMQELEVKEKDFVLINRLIDDRFGELNLREEIFELKEMKFVEEVKEKEKKYEECCEEFKLKEKQLVLRSKDVELKGKSYVELSKGVELKDKKLEEQSKNLKLKEKQLELRSKEVELKGKSYVELSKGVELKDKKLEEQSKQLKLKEKQLEEQSRELELNYKKFEDQYKELVSKGKQIEEWSRELELKDKKFEHRFKEVELKEKQVEERSKEIETKDKKFEERFKDFELKEKLLEERSIELVLKDKKLEELCKEFELKEKMVEERSKEVELKEKKYANALHTQVKTEPEEQILVNSASKGANLQFCVSMDGKHLQIFLNEQWKEHDSMRNEVLVALQLSSDPAKLVLDAMQGFYPPHLKKGDVEFEESVIRRTCILLLEQLMKLSPEMKPDVIKEAMKLAFDWITKMRVDVRHSLEVLGFLQLLATYKLAHAFDADELLNYLEIVAQHNQAPELLRVLGFAEKISGFIQNLISKDQEVEAIKFIYAFKLGAQFPPVPLLENYLQRSRKDADKFMMKGYKSLKEHDEAKNKRLDDLKAVIRCIEDHKLESEYPPFELKSLVALLENQNAINQLTTLALGPNTPSKLQSGSKRPWTAELADASPNTFESATSIVPSLQMPCQQPKGLNSNQDFIQNLVEREQRLDAIKYIYAWNMVDKFPPVGLLNDHLMYSKKNIKEFCKRNNYNRSSQIGAITKEISALRDVIKCIENYKLEPELSPEIHKQRIVQLKEKKSRKQAVQLQKKNSQKQAKTVTRRSKAKLLQQKKEKNQKKRKKRNAPTSASSLPAVPAPNKVTTPSPTAAPTTATVPATKLQQESGNKRPRIAVSANQPPHQQPAMLPIPAVTCMNAPTGHYNLAGFTPMNFNTSSYHNNFNPYYPWDALRRPGYY